jgi:hypothetical protein
VVHTVLNDAGLKTVSCEEAAKLSKQGWTLIDVRLAGDFEKWHAEGAVNVPLYRYVEGQVGRMLSARQFHAAAREGRHGAALRHGCSRLSAAPRVNVVRASVVGVGSGEFSEATGVIRALTFCCVRLSLHLQGPWDNLKRLAMFAFAMKATERNPDFISERDSGCRLPPARRRCGRLLGGCCRLWNMSLASTHQQQGPHARLCLQATFLPRAPC